jgi:hypothetical protein
LNAQNRVARTKKLPKDDPDQPDPTQDAERDCRQRVGRLRIDATQDQLEDEPIDQVRLSVPNDGAALTCRV